MLMNEFIKFIHLLLNLEQMYTELTNSNLPSIQRKDYFNRIKTDSVTVVRTGVSKLSKWSALRSRHSAQVKRQYVVNYLSDWILLPEPLDIEIWMKLKMYP